MKKEHVQLLEAFYTFPYMTREQVARLGIYSDKSATSTIARFLEEKFSTGYLLRDKEVNANNFPYYYWLSEKGRNVLTLLGYDFSSWRQPEQMRPFIKSVLFPHYVGTTDFLICANGVPGITDLLHYMNLNYIMKPSHGDGRQDPPIPDGLIKFRSGISLWVEWDNNTEKGSKFEKKITNLAEFIKVDWSDWFTTKPEQTTFLFCTAISEERTQVMKHTVEVILERLNLKKMGNQFVFAYTPILDTHTVFFTPVWEYAYHSGKHILLGV